MKIKAANTILYCKKWRETVEFYRDGLKLLSLSSTDWFVEFKLNESARLSVANETRASVKSGDGRGVTISLQRGVGFQGHLSARPRRQPT